MTLMEAINKTDELKHNTYPQGVKIGWLSAVDQRVKTLIMDTHESGETVLFSGYGEDAKPDTVLLIPAPFDEVYLRWLEAQIDYHNGEIKKYNNAIELYNVAWQAYQNHYNRTHMPKGKKMKYF